MGWSFSYEDPNLLMSKPCRVVKVYESYLDKNQWILSECIRMKYMWYNQNVSILLEHFPSSLCFEKLWNPLISATVYHCLFFSLFVFPNCRSFWPTPVPVAPLLLSSLLLFIELCKYILIEVAGNIYYCYSQLVLKRSLYSLSFFIYLEMINTHNLIS